MKDVLKIGYHESPLKYDSVDWFVDTVSKLENKMVFYFKNTNRELIVTEEDESFGKNDTFCRICERR